MFGHVQNLMVVVVLLWLTACCSAQRVYSASKPLPEGDNGIAAKYPGDIGIERDRAVVFYDGFENCSRASSLRRKWDVVAHNRGIRIAEEPANVNSGRKAVEFTVPRQQTPSSIAMAKRLKYERDILFLRYYTKFEKGFQVPRASCHNGGSISAHYFPGGRATPGRRADGRNKFLVNFETDTYANTPSPGPLNIYCYHPEQRGRYGDHLYSTGKVLPFSSQPHPFGPQFVSRQNVVPQLDRWYCHELMVKANTPGKRDGRIACWVDGKLIADFPNLRLRDVKTLRIDRFGIGLFIARNTVRANKKWYDDVVAATSYIGPIFTGKPAGRKPKGKLVPPAGWPR